MGSESDGYEKEKRLIIVIVAVLLLCIGGGVYFHTVVSRRNETTGMPANIPLIAALRSSYAIFRVDRITDEVSVYAKDYVKLECTHIYKIDASWTEGEPVDIYYRSIWLGEEHLEEGKTYFARVVNAKTGGLIKIGVDNHGGGPMVAPSKMGIWKLMMHWEHRGM